MKNTVTYWEDRYFRGGDSGYGSYDAWAMFKARIVNAFVLEHQIKTVIEWGCGDGNQLTYMRYESYCGYDISKTAIEICKQKFQKDKSKTFKLYDGKPVLSIIPKADLSLSLDVIYHLLEDELYFSYMSNLFGSSNQYVVIYSIDSNDMQNYMEEMGNSTVAYPEHMRLWKFTEYINDYFKEWKLINIIHPDKNIGKSLTNFYFYERVV